MAKDIASYFLEEGQPIVPKPKPKQYLKSLLTKEHDDGIEYWNDWLLGWNSEERYEDEVAYRKQIRSLLWEVRSTCG